MTSLQSIDVVSLSPLLCEPLFSDQSCTVPSFFWGGLQFLEPKVGFFFFPPPP